MWKALNVLPALPIVIALMVGSAGLSGCASLEEEVDHLQFAVLSPARDANLLQQPIPEQLQYLSHPYGHAAQSGCAAWTSEIRQLETAIIANDGRRPGFRRDPNTFVGRTGNLRDAGVRALSRSVLPFRGIVRQVSGAAKLEQNADSASDRARYRIGYLVGLARSNGCAGFSESPVRMATPASPYSPAVVRQSYPTLRAPSYRTQAAHSYMMQPHSFRQVHPVRTAPTPSAQTHYGQPQPLYYQRSNPVVRSQPAPSHYSAPQYSAPRTVYHAPASRGRLRSSRR